jgi:ketosteroid isomerase-like protein
MLKVPGVKKAENQKKAEKDSRQANAGLVQAFTQAMTHEDIESILNLFSPDGEWVVMATGEAFRGPDQIRRMVSRSLDDRDHQAGVGPQPFNVFTDLDGTKLCWEYLHKGVVTENWPLWPHRPAPGTRFDLPIILICEIHEGKLIKIREYFDLWALTEAGTPNRRYS